MRILYIYQYFGTPKGSWSTRVYELTRRWAEKGHQITIITSPYYKSDIRGKGFISRQKIDGIQLIVVNAADSNKASTLKRAANALVFAITSTFLALWEKMDICISSSGPITTALPGLLAKWFRGTPLVFEVRDLWPRGGIELGKLRSKWLIKIALWFEQFIYRNSNLVVACSTGMEKGVKKVNPDVPTLVIPNASDPELFDNYKGTPSSSLFQKIKDKAIFLYAGSLGLMDDCSQSIKALSYLRDQPIALVLAGDGAERELLESLAMQTGNSNIYFLGLLPKTEVAKWFSVATASIITFRDYPVLHTSSPNKMFDSFAAGVPIIQTTKGWIKELVEQEECGINVEPNDPISMASAMKTLAEKSELVSEMSQKSKSLASTKFNRDLLAKQYLESLQRIVSPPQ